MRRAHGYRIIQVIDRQAAPFRRELAVSREAKQDFTRRIARENRHDAEGSQILWSRHAIAELANEGWSRLAVEAGEVVEDYPTMHRALPDCLVLGWMGPEQPFHAVVALDERHDRLLVVTVYAPSSEEWESDWRTRRP